MLQRQDGGPDGAQGVGDYFGAAQNVVGGESGNLGVRAGFFEAPCRRGDVA